MNRACRRKDGDSLVLLAPLVREAFVPIFTGAARPFTVRARIPTVKFAILLSMRGCSIAVAIPHNNLTRHTTCSRVPIGIDQLRARARGGIHAAPPMTISIIERLCPVRSTTKAGARQKERPASVSRRPKAEDKRAGLSFVGSPGIYRKAVPGPILSVRNTLLVHACGPSASG